MQSAVAAAMLLLLCCCCRCWLCCLLPQLGRDCLVASVQGSGEIVLTAQLLQGQPQRLGLPRCGAAPLLPPPCPVLLCRAPAGPLLLRLGRSRVLGTCANAGRDGQSALRAWYLGLQRHCCCSGEVGSRPPWDL